MKLHIIFRTPEEEMASKADAYDAWTEYQIAEDPDGFEEAKKEAATHIIPHLVRVAVIDIGEDYLTQLFLGEGDDDEEEDEDDDDEEEDDENEL